MRDTDKSTLIDIAIANNTVYQEANKELGITQEYNADNRANLWDSTKDKAEYKEKVFGDKQTYEDKISGNTLHKSQQAAQNKYHMKNKDGKNISKEWAKHSSETDHINALKDVHDVAKHNPFLSDADFKEIMNSEENYRILSKSANAAKGDKSDWELVFDKDNGITSEGRKQIVKEKIKSDVVLQGKFTARTVKNVGAEFATGAKDTLVNSAIPITTEAVRKMIQVAQGKQSVTEAAKDMGKVAVDVAVTGGTNQVLITALTNTMANSKSALLKKIASSNEVGQIIAVATIVKESAVKYINGEIDGEKFIDEVGEKGATMVAGMIGGKVGKEIGGLLGLSMGMVSGLGGAAVGCVVGETIGQILGTVITTIACSSIIAVYNTAKNLDGYKLKEKQVKRLEADALKEMSNQREKFGKIISRENKKMESEIQEGFDLIVSNACKEEYSLEGVTEGLDKVLAVFGKSVKFKNLDEYEAQLDSTLKLSF